MYYDFWNDNISSLNNRTTAGYAWFSQNNFTGQVTTTWPNTKYSNVPDGMNNLISSHY